VGKASVDLEGKISVVTRELNEAREQQAATSSILRAIAASPTDILPVLNAVAESATQLCEAHDAAIFLRRGQALALAAHHGPISFDFAEWPIGRDWVTGRAVLDRASVHVDDLSKAGDEFPAGREMAIRIGHRTTLAIPLMREDNAIGALLIRRMEVRPFTPRQVELLKTFADQAVIAIENVRLFDEVNARTAELSKALQQQTATAEVLKVISRSAFNLESVLQTLVESAARLCDADKSTITRQIGGRFYRAEAYGFSSEFLEFVRNVPVEPERGSVSGRALLDGRAVHIPDIEADPEYTFEGARRLGDFRTALGVPMLRDGVAIGVLSLTRSKVRPFTEKQIELVSTFADQAAIAIENARLFEEVQARNREVTQALEQQKATSEILRVISTSPTDVQPVFEAMVRNAVALCGSLYANVFRFDSGLLYFVASHNVDPSHVDMVRAKYPMRPDTSQVSGRVVLTRSVVRLEDALADPNYDQRFPAAMGWRRMLGVPMLRQGELLGVIVVGWAEAGPVPPAQEELLKQFADQAIIAIENARLFEEVQARNREVTQALEQQKATSEILRVISTSPTDVQPVFETIVRNAVALCGSLFANVFRFDDGLLHFVASHNVGPRYVDLVRKKYPMRPDASQVSGRVLLTKSVVWLEDATADPNYDQRFPAAMGWRRMLGVPMLRQGEPLGVIVVGWAESGPLLPAQEELLKQFADQAVIAIENTRLFEEVQAKTRDLEEALTFQKGTGDVLEAIGRSASSLQPVLDAIVETAADLCRAELAAVRLLKDGALHHAAASGRNDATLASYSRQRPELAVDRSSVAGRVVLEGRTVHIHNIAADAEYTFLDSLGKDVSVGSALGVPLLQDGKVAGAIVLLRRTIDPFTERQIGLVETFADQAVIAIENVRLFQEVQARTRELSRSLEELRTTQDRLIQTEKLASLGQLTAGIAHEIKNPLNFVNNFAALSAELIGELQQVLQDAAIEGTVRADVDELAAMLRGNLDKIVQHGKRADSIVKNMLLHSRQGSGEHRPVGVNAIVEESLNLAYHGARAEKQGFNITLKTSLDPEAGEVDLYPQEITRVLLNLISNGFYATGKRAAEAGNGYEPMLAATTRSLGDRVEIRIRDNGTGIAQEVKDKMFNPFFTTKPAGEGTGLGLSLSHDIVVKQHAGTIEVDSEPGEYTEFRIILPRSAATIAKSEGKG
jgi:GAF domain-containing protein